MAIPPTSALAQHCLDTWPAIFCRVFLEGGLSSEDQKTIGNHLDPNALSETFVSDGLESDVKARLLRALEAVEIPVAIPQPLRHELYDMASPEDNELEPPSDDALWIRLLHSIVIQGHGVFQDHRVSQELYSSSRLQGYQEAIAGQMILSQVMKETHDTDFLHQLQESHLKYWRQLDPQASPYLTHPDRLPIGADAHEDDVRPFIASPESMRMEPNPLCAYCDRPILLGDRVYLEACGQHHFHANDLKGRDGKLGLDCGMCERRWEEAEDFPEYLRLTQELLRGRLTHGLDGRLERRAEPFLAPLSQMVDLGILPLRIQVGGKAHDGKREVEKREYVAFIVPAKGSVNPQKFLSGLKERASRTSALVSGLDMEKDERLSGADDGDFVERSRAEDGHWEYSRRRGELQQMRDDELLDDVVLRRGIRFIEVIDQDWGSAGKLFRSIADAAQTARA